MAHYDELLSSAADRAGRHLVCTPGCTACCIGIFDITALDADRLRRGLRQLLGVDPRAAQALVETARLQWSRLEPHFPGDSAKGVLEDDQRVREALFGSFSELPCALLDASGRCRLYAHRPLSCRSYGMPVRLGEVVLEPCPLNFTTAGPTEVEASTMVLDPDDLEGALLEAMSRGGKPAADTIVCAALAADDVRRQAP